MSETASGRKRDKVILGDLAREQLEKAPDCEGFWYSLKMSLGLGDIEVVEAQFDEQTEIKDMVAQGFTAFCGFNDFVFYVNIESSKGFFTIKGKPTHAEERTNSGVGYEVQVLTRAYLAATDDDWRVDEEEKKALLALRILFQVDDETIYEVKRRVLGEFAHRVAEDLVVEQREQELLKAIQNELNISEADRVMVASLQLTVRANELIAKEDLTAEEVEQWKRLAETLTIDPQIFKQQQTRLEQRLGR